MLGLLLGLDDDILDDERLNEVGVDDLLVLTDLPGKINQRLFGVDDDTDDSAIEMATDVLRTHLLKLRLPVVEVDLDLALDEEVPALFHDPLSETIADPHAEVDEIGIEKWLSVGIGDLDWNIEVPLLIDRPREGLREGQFVLVLPVPEDLGEDGLMRGKGDLIELAMRL
jgi:hypothetical protein